MTWRVASSQLMSLPLCQILSVLLMAIRTPWSFHYIGVSGCVGGGGLLVLACWNGAGMVRGFRARVEFGGETPPGQPPRRRRYARQLQCARPLPCARETIFVLSRLLAFSASLGSRRRNRARLCSWQI